MSSDDLDFLATLVHTRTGLVLQGDRAYLAQTRLSVLARREGLASVDDLIADLRATGDVRLVQAAVEAMATADTAFFRDKAVFDHIRSALLPELAQRSGDGRVHAWCAGCSTGQEAYSLAMTAADAVDEHPRLALDIVGTDLSRRVLEKAHSGLYTQFEVQRGLPIRALLKHFDKVDDMWRASEDLRQQVRWRQLNLLDERRSLRPFDLILCRNVTGAFDAETRQRVLSQMAPALAPHGYLVLGAGEAEEPSAYETVDRGLRIFRRTRIAGRAAA